MRKYGIVIEKHFKGKRKTCLLRLINSIQLGKIRKILFKGIFQKDP